VLDERREAEACAVEHEEDDDECEEDDTKGSCTQPNAC
jgi:hypothetical protein